MKTAALAEALAIALRNPPDEPREEDFDVNEGMMFLGTCAVEKMSSTDTDRLRALRWTWQPRFACWAKPL